MYFILNTGYKVSHVLIQFQSLGTFERERSCIAWERVSQDQKCMWMASVTQTEKAEQLKQTYIFVLEWESGDLQRKFSWNEIRKI